MQRPLVHLGGDAHAQRLLIVHGKMLEAGADALALGPADEPGGQLARQQRVLGIVFKVAPAQRAALDVDARPQNNGHAVGPALPADGRAHPARQRGAPRAGQRRRSGKARCFHAVAAVLTDVQTVLLAQAVRAVRQPYGRHALGRDVLRLPKALSAGQGCFFLQRQRSDDVPDPIICHGFPSGAACALKFRAIPHNSKSRSAPTGFLACQTKSAANTLCIREHFCDSCRKICKRGDASGVSRELCGLALGHTPGPPAC